MKLFLGDDIGLSRRKFLEQKNDYQADGYLIIDLTVDNLGELDRWLLTAQSLFEEKKAFFGENLLSKKESRAIMKQIIDKTTIDFLIWEETLDERSAKLYFKNATISVSKLPANIFKWLDSIYPKNAKNCLLLLNDISQVIDENIIFYMLQRRMRELLLIKNNYLPKKSLADWQLNKLKFQAKLWEPNNLIKCYDALFRIDSYAKTATNYYSIKEALDILFIYYL